MAVAKSRECFAPQPVIPLRYNDWRTDTTSGVKFILFVFEVLAFSVRAAIAHDSMIHQLDTRTQVHTHARCRRRLQRVNCENLAIARNAFGFYNKSARVLRKGFRIGCVRMHSHGQETLSLRDVDGEFVDAKSN